MKKEREKTNLLPGVLRGNAFECNCTVALVTKLNHESPSVAVWTSIKITTAEQPLPDGAYHLDVHGRIFNVNRENGKWATLKL
jgi:hypothetical protein